MGEVTGPHGYRFDSFNFVQYGPQQRGDLLVAQLNHARSAGYIEGVEAALWRLGGMLLVSGVVVAVMVWRCG